MFLDVLFSDIARPRRNPCREPSFLLCQKKRSKRRPHFHPSWHTKRYHRKPAAPSCTNHPSPYALFGWVREGAFPGEKPSPACTATTRPRCNPCRGPSFLLCQKKRSKRRPHLYTTRRAKETTASRQSLFQTIHASSWINGPLFHQAIHFHKREIRTRSLQEASSDFSAMVEHRRFELLTPTLPVLCATNCANAPHFSEMNNTTFPKKSKPLFSKKSKFFNDVG